MYEILSLNKYSKSNLKHFKIRFWVFKTSAPYYLISDSEKFKKTFYKTTFEAKHKVLKSKYNLLLY